jgi:hypothetical protein
VGCVHYRLGLSSKRSPFNPTWQPEYLVGLHLLDPGGSLF